MKKLVFVNTLSILLLFMGGGTVVFAQDVPTPDTDLRSQMRERMKVQQENMENRVENREIHMMEREERQASAETRLEERYAEARTRFEERRADMLRRQEEVRQRMEARHEDLRQRWEERKVQLSDRRKQNIKNHIERIIQRMEQAIERLRNLANKIEDRLSRLEKEGADVATLRLLFQEARISIDRTDAMLDTTGAELRVAPDTDNPADALGNARALLESVKTALREAHAALVEVVVEIKKGQLIPDDDDSK